MPREPLVSVITPVLNGAAFVSECAQSVLAQTYDNWEYIVVDNCSTDETVEHIERYAQTSPKVRIHRNQERVSLAENHNIGLSLISEESRYVKFVHADDWLYPDCLQKMVDLAEAHPGVGIVGAYGLSDHQVRWAGLPYSSSVIPGREICRRSLLGGFYVFGSPSSLLFRSDLAREGKPLFKQSPYPAFCDQEACYSSLSDWDFGFVHQVLTYTRLHEGSSTSRDRTSGLNVDEATRLYVLAQYGRTYLSDDEYRGRLDDLLRRYYRFLGSQALRMRGNEFWTYHGTVLGQAGRPIRWERVAGACIAGAARSLLRPASLLKRAFRPL